MLNWKKELPTVPGKYWFYGYRWKHHDEKELLFGEFQKTASGGLIGIFAGHVLWKSELGFDWVIAPAIDIPNPENLLMKKIILAVSEQVSTEHEGESFIEVYEKYKGQNVLLILQKWIPDSQGIGYVFSEEAVIGNCKKPLYDKDYYSAYDIIF